jgi:uncharacterized protein
MSFKEIFKEIIAEFHAALPPIPVKRNIVLPNLEGLRKALVFIGMRRSGKTWTLYQIMHDLISKGTDLTKILYLNFEDDRLSDMTTKNFQDILRAYFELYPEYVGRDDIHFFFDEIHEVDVWQKFIRRLLDQEKVHIYITGSSAKMLSKEIASTLRGRTFAQEIFPYSFVEYLSALQVELPKNILGKNRITLMHHVRNFLKWGGFPETVGKEPDIHRALLQEYISTVIYRDIIERYMIKSIHPLRLLLTHCLRNSATVFSINKMYKTFKSLGHEVSKSALYEYMDYFEDAYCVFSLEKFDLSQRKSTTSMKKIFAVDQGLITAETMASNFDEAAQLETAVFAYLRRKSEKIFYYTTQDGKEVDFIMILPDQQAFLYQVSLTLQEASTRKREINALVTAMSELNLRNGVIITLEEEEEIVLEQGRIMVMPLIKFLINIQ